MESIRSNKISYLFIFCLLAFSNFEYFFRENSLIFGLYIISILIGFVFINKKFISSDFLLLFLLIIFVTAIQGILGLNTGLNPIIFLIVSLMGSLCVSWILREFFVKAIIGVIYFIAIYSLIIYILCLNDGIYDYLFNTLAQNNSLNVEDAVFDEGGRNFVIYNFQIDYILESAGFRRNCGPFWEPGMFAVYLLVGIFFNVFISPQKFPCCNIILILALISTFSTGGYLGGIILLCFYIVKVGVKSLASILIIPACIVGILYIYSLDYIGGKTENQFETAEEGSDLTRYGAFITQIKMIESSPILGGEALEKYASSNTLASGTLLPFVNYGLPVGILYYILLYKACRNIAAIYRKKREGIEMFILILAISFSQTILMNAFFLLLLIFGITYKTNHSHV